MFGFLRFDAGSWVLGVPGLGWVAIGILIGDSGWFWLDYWSWICGVGVQCCLLFGVCIWFCVLLYVCWCLVFGGLVVWFDLALC